MFDTHAIARPRTEAGLKPEQASAITDAVRQVAKHGDHVTPDRLDVKIADVRSTTTPP